MKPGMFSDDVTDVLHECTYMRMYMSEGGGCLGLNMSVMTSATYLMNQLFLQSVRQSPVVCWMSSPG